MTWYGGIEGMWDLYHFILGKPSLYLGDLIPGTWPPFIISDLDGKYMVHFTHGDIIDIPLDIAYPVDYPPPPPRAIRGIRRTPAWTF